MYGKNCRSSGTDAHGFGFGDAYVVSEFVGNDALEKQHLETVECSTSLVHSDIRTLDGQVFSVQGFLCIFIGEHADVSVTGLLDNDPQFWMVINLIPINKN